MVTQTVEFNTKTVNPFYGMSNTLQIFQDAAKGLSISRKKLDGAWSECKGDTDRLAVLISVLFSVGDVTARQHNAFEGKVESGGHAQRNVFRDQIVPFLVEKISSQNKATRLKLIGLVTEYTVMDNVLANRVVTKKGSSKVVNIVDMVSVFGEQDLATYAANIIRKGTVFQKTCLAKYLTRPRLSKRKGHKQLLPETKAIMLRRQSLIKRLSDLVKFPYTDNGSYIDFEGYYAWRKEFNKDFESVIFSTQSVRDLDKEEFLELLDKMPSDARFRTRNKVLFNDKWGHLKDWFQEWESFKEAKQKEQRELEALVASGDADEIDLAKLKQVKKDAKVNSGSVSFTQLFRDIVNGSVDRLKVQPFLDKVSLPYNSLVFIDDSGSMNSSWGSNSNYGFTPRQFAAFIATIVLSKNPDPDARNIVGLFSSTCRMANGVTSRNVRKNSIMNGSTINHNKVNLIDDKKHFLDNLRTFKQFLDANSSMRGTNVSSIPEGLNAWVNGDPNRLEEVRRFPVWTLISDGNFNNLGGASSSLNDFMRKCENYFGYRPFLILIDVAGSTSQDIVQFSGIDNVMMVPPNPANIEMFLTNFKDMDVYDVYTPLQSVFRSKRYAPIREFVGSL